MVGRGRGVRGRVRGVGGGGGRGGGPSSGSDPRGSIKGILGFFQDTPFDP